MIESVKCGTQLVWIPVKQLKRRKFVCSIFLFIFVYIAFLFTFQPIIFYTKDWRLEYEKRFNASNFYCDGELFSYQHASAWNSTKVLQRGWPFDCSRLKLLQELKLTQNDTIDEVVESNYPDDLVFVSAANAESCKGNSNYSFFVPEQVAFVSVRKHFGSKNRFILYDLGGLREKFGDKISKMCNVELRTFNFSKLPTEVRDFKKFSWKIWILAEVLKEAKNIIYLDSSIFFLANTYDQIFKSMSSPKFELTPFQLSGNTGHPFRFATSNDMYNFLPLDLRVQYSVDMFEANLLFLHRNEQTRQLMKWAVLCAMTLECIDPPGSTINCDYSRWHEINICHRQDQSLLNILIRNMEFDLRQRGYLTLPMDASAHPMRKKARHLVKRCQQLIGNETLTC